MYFSERKTSVHREGGLSYSTSSASFPAPVRGRHSSIFYSPTVVGSASFTIACPLPLLFANSERLVILVLPKNSLESVLVSLIVV